MKFQFPRIFFFSALLLVTNVFMSAANGKVLQISPRPALPKIPANVVNLADFGRGDGQTLNTTAFEKALAKLAERGGGKLVVPPGLWLTGPIKLRSHTELHMERGALIQFSGDWKMYPLTVINLRGEKEVDSTSPLSAENAEDIAITGEGIIDGGGDAWRPIKKDKLTEREWKAQLKTGGVLDVTFQNPPNWTVNPVLCDDVSILNMRVFNSPTAQNSDALDLESCRHAIIRGCTFDVGDDGICLKSGKDDVGRRIGVPTEDVLVENCVVYHAHGGFTIGSEMSGGVRNVRVNNCLFLGTDIGLRFKSTRGRGGVVENIFISNVNMQDIPGDAINFNLYYGGKSPLDEAAANAETNFSPVTEATPQFREIHLENIVCRGAKNAIVLQGLSEMPLNHISLKNVTMTSQFGASVTDAENITFENVRLENNGNVPVKTLRVKNSKLELTK